MQPVKRRRKKIRTTRRNLSVKWVKAAALALAAVLCFAIVWFAWLRPERTMPTPLSPEYSIPAVTPIETPAPSPSPAAASPTATPTPTPSPTPTQLPQAAPCSPGDTGENVAMLQQMLLELGFDPGEADGTYGAQLKAAVRNFQLYAGISADGIAGTETAAALTQRWQAAQRNEAAQEQPLAGCVIGIDPGHQRHANSEQEPISPDGTETKAKVSSGTQGQFTGVPEYAVNLQVALKLKAALEALGAQVVMTRETHGVDISNAQRAQMMNEADVDCWLRIHANYNANPDTHGMFILIPAEGSVNTDDASVIESSARLAQALLESAVEETGADNRGIVERGDQTGFGWSQVPVCNIEMGYMSNEAEDRLLVTETYQQKIVGGLTEGFIQYFADLS